MYLYYQIKKKILELLQIYLHIRYITSHILYLCRHEYVIAHINNACMYFYIYVCMYVRVCTYMMLMHFNESYKCLIKKLSYQTWNYASTAMIS